MNETVRLMNSLVPMTQFNRGHAAQIFDRLRKERRLVVLKNNQPAAVILSPEEFSRLSELEEDFALLLEAEERLEHDRATSTPFEDVMSELGIREEELAGVGDVVIE